MNEIETQNGSLATYWWIVVGATLFIVALMVSALVVPNLRLLHFLQAFIYVAIVILARRKSVWGLGAGVTIGIAWNSLNLFVTHNMQDGAVEFWSFLQTGHIHRLETIMVTLGGVAHFILIIACLTAFFHLRSDKKKWQKFIGGGLLTIIYMSLIIAVARPR